MRSLSHRLLIVPLLLCAEGCLLPEHSFSNNDNRRVFEPKVTSTPDTSDLKSRPPRRTLKADEFNDDESSRSAQDLVSAGYSPADDRHDPDANRRGSNRLAATSRNALAESRPGEVDLSRPNDRSNPIQLLGMEAESDSQTDGSPPRSSSITTMDSNVQTSDRSIPFSGTRSAQSRPNSTEIPPTATLYPIDRNLPPSNDANWQDELNRLIDRIEKELVKAPNEKDKGKRDDYLLRQAQLRLMYLVAQRNQDALTVIPDVEPTQQEFWQQIIWAMSNSLDTAQTPDVSERAARTIPRLTAALRKMREEAPLAIKNMAFCRKISYFGNYERFPRDEFTPGYEVLLYTEIDNFVTAPTDDGEYRTSLKSLIEIVDSEGKVVWTKSFPSSTEDICKNPRRDYFQNYHFHIPDDLQPGNFSLRLTIEDEIGNKRTTKSVNFVLK
jgi:hypothetical protein